MSTDMKYKVGDRVVIKPWLLMEKQYGLDGCGNINTCGPNDKGCSFWPKQERMLKGTDRVVVITEVEEWFYFGKQLDRLGFTDDNILGYAFDYGEEIEVSDDGRTWDVRRFISYTPGSVLTINALNPTFGSDFIRGLPFGSLLYKFARPIQEPVIEQRGLITAIETISDLCDARKEVGIGYDGAIDEIAKAAVAIWKGE